MPLNHETGEHIEGLGIGSVVPLSKWADTNLFEAAFEDAERAFIKSGAILPIAFDEREILVMEYPHQDRIVFLFCKHIAGTEKLYPAVIKLTPPLVAELVNMNRWTRVQ